MPSIIGWIKNGRKGKNLAYMPASYPSERVAYGNGSVKDALDELNADLIKKVGASASGKTFKQQLTELYAVWQTLSYTHKQRAYLKVGDGIMHIYDIPTGKFTNVAAGSGNIYVFCFDLSAGLFYMSTGITVADNSNAIDNAVIELYA